jgi:hypothetical protein
MKTGQMKMFFARIRSMTVGELFTCLFVQNAFNSVIAAIF